MINETNIEKIVMRRIRVIRILALVISTATLAVLAFSASLWGIGREVWVARVFENAPADLASAPRFFIDAFVHTSFIVKTLIVLAIISFAFLVRETVRFLRDVFVSSG